METQRISIAELACDPANVRAHDAKNLDAIKGSLQRFGQQKPIVVDEKGIVVAGNGTLTAARALGWDSINVVQTDLAGAEAVAYAIADNRTAELAEWDDEALAKQLSALQIEDEALVEAAGFSDAELTDLVNGVTGFQPDGTSTKEISLDDLDTKHQCPSCGFEFDKMVSDEA
jgi:ParB-like chromosome segregation protein Spo0J